MIRYLRIQWLRFRAAVIEAQIDHGHALIADHEARLAACYRELRRVRSAEATITPAPKLLEQAMRRKYVNSPRQEVK